MAFIIRVIKLNNTLYIRIPAYFRRYNKIKHGDFFQLDGDVMLPDHYTLKKIGSEDGKLKNNN
mgnify:CR=1 FL=1